MNSLNTLLELICERTKLHICIHDISGILRYDELKIDKKYHTHTRSVCNAAKCTSAGYNACISCKDASNRDALAGKICRTCPFGVYEIINPVIVNGKTRCIVYLGNMSEGYESSVSIAMETCRRLSIEPEKIVSELAFTEIIGNTLPQKDYYDMLSDFICDYIRSVCIAKDIPKKESAEKKRHWCVEKAEEYISCNYENNMTLASVAKLYFINEKYLGRIFKKQTGKSFHQYLTDVRLEKSLQLLSGGLSVIDISHLCGFANVTYYNRCFKKKYGVSPIEYRNKNQDGSI